MGEGFGDFSEAFSTGQGFGWHQRTADHWHGTDAFTRVALPTELIAAAIERDHRCGNGSGTRWRGGRCRLRLRRADPGHRRPVPGRAGAGDRLPRRVDRPRPRRVRRQRGRATPGSRWPPRPSCPGGGLRPDHLLRLAARHRRPPRRARPGPGRRSRRPGRCCCSSRSAPTTSRTTSTRRAGCSTPSRPWPAHRTRSPRRTGDVVRAARRAGRRDSASASLAAEAGFSRVRRCRSRRR